MLDSSRTQQLVVIIGEGSVFDEGVAKLLTNGTRFLVVLTKYTSGPALLNMLEQDCPDVVVICQALTLDTAQILDQISSLPRALSMLTIVLRVNDEVIDVYANPGLVARRKPERIVVASEAALINVVRRVHEGR